MLLTHFAPPPLEFISIFTTNPITMYFYYYFSYACVCVARAIVIELNVSGNFDWNIVNIIKTQHIKNACYFRFRAIQVHTVTTYYSFIKLNPLFAFSFVLCVDQLQAKRRLYSRILFKKTSNVVWGEEPSFCLKKKYVKSDTNDIIHLILSNEMMLQRFN